jgi:hypothetical protein
MSVNEQITAGVIIPRQIPVTHFATHAVRGFMKGNKTYILLDIMPRSPSKVNRRSAETCRLHLQYQMTGPFTLPLLGHQLCPILALINPKPFLHVLYCCSFYPLPCAYDLLPIFPFPLSSQPTTNSTESHIFLNYPWVPRSQKTSTRKIRQL